MIKSQQVTAKHISRVRELLNGFAKDIIYRGKRHDISKYDPIEAGPLEILQQTIDTEGPAAFGSDEYHRRTALLGPMLAHHYVHNTHHPEHYQNGIAGMNLLDLVEMFFDWRAAAERGGDISMNLTYCETKYEIPPMLISILRNTADQMGFEHK